MNLVISLAKSFVRMVAVATIMTITSQAAFTQQPARTSEHESVAVDESAHTHLLHYSRNRFREAVARHIVERFLEAFEREDLDAISPLLSEQVVVVQPLTRSGNAAPESFVRYDGKEAVIGFIQEVFTRNVQIRFVDSRLSVADGGRSVFVETTGDFVTTFNAPYRNVYVLKFEIRNGKFVRLVEYNNPVTFALTFGLPLGPGN